MVTFIQNFAKCFIPVFHHVARKSTVFCEIFLWDLTECTGNLFPGRRGLERTDNDPHVSYGAGATSSLFLPQFYGNYSDAQFKMITPITEGNARGMCPIDNKGSSVSYASGGRNSSLNGGWMVGLRHYYLKHILPKTSHSAIHHANCIIKGKRRSKGFLELKYSIPPILFYIFYL